MTILPLIERELRRRARKRAVYWTRFLVALAGILLCLSTLDISSGSSGASRGMLGQSAFQGISLAAFVLCCCAVFLTVDGISRERREGTLGLLCLTRVKTLDILVGNFGAAGITCVCVLMALVPVIILPVLAGGVTGGEAFRTSLVLLDTLFLSLAVGLWGSAGAHEWFQSTRSAVVFLLVIILAPIFALILTGPGTYLYGISPLAAFFLANDVVYRVSEASYWFSLTAVHAISWCLLIAAGWRLRRAMRVDNGKSENISASRWEASEGGKAMVNTDILTQRRAFTLAAWKIPFPSKVDVDDPVGWLVSRQFGVKPAVWAGVLLGLIPFAVGWTRVWFGSAFIMPGNSFNSWPVSVAFALVQGCLFAWAASRFLVESRRSGELELLLVSPAGAKTIVSSQWKQLQRLFLVPAILLTLPNLMLTIYYTFLSKQPSYRLASAWTWSYSLYSALAPLLHGVQIILSFGALIWASLWFGLRARSQTSAIVYSILFARGVPYLMIFAASSFLSLNVLRTRVYGAGYLRFPWWNWLYLLSSILVCLYYLGLMGWAKRCLTREMTNPSQNGFDFSDAIAEARTGLASMFQKVRNWPPTPNH